jgi:hypothetical protein
MSKLVKIIQNAFLKRNEPAWMAGFVVQESILWTFNIHTPGYARY